jgi:hypothetical protein
VLVVVLGVGGAEGGGHAPRQDGRLRPRLPLHRLLLLLLTASLNTENSCSEFIV